MINFELQFGGSRRQKARSVHTPAGATSLRMTEAVHRQVMAAVGTKVPEQGMLLGGDPADGIVRHVVFDDGAERTGSTYSPDHVRLNRLLSEWWGPSGIRLLGFVHSHPGRFARPSGGDLNYARVILGSNPHLGQLLMPIVTVDPEPTLHPFIAVRSGEDVEVKPATLEVLNEVVACSAAASAPVAGSISATTMSAAGRRRSTSRCSTRSSVG